MAGRFIIASQRPWNAQLAARLAARTGCEFASVGDLAELQERLALRPRYIFFAHWSDRIPELIWRTNESVIFHMTDVPYGRGGSPLQNLIARGHGSTMVSAIQCVEALDAGPVYLKRPLSLAGSAEEIFTRADKVIEEMIVEIVEANPLPIPQSGEPTVFRRRRPAEGNLETAETLKDWYDGIRMLDAPGYPHAFIDVGGFRLEFRRAHEGPGLVEAEVAITKNRPDGSQSTC